VASRRDAPDVVNADGDHIAFRVGDTGRAHASADVQGHGGRLSGYVSAIERRVPDCSLAQIFGV
jgi:hypothetical protein